MLLSTEALALLARIPMGGGSEEEAPEKPGG